MSDERVPSSGCRPAPGSRSYPPPERWDDWVEFDAEAWPRRVEQRYTLVPTICFNCEAACGLLAYVDKDTMRIRKFEGNPLHPGSRGRNCAKGPATINQINDPERILYPLRRVGARGEGKCRARHLGRGARRHRRRASARRSSRAARTRSCTTSAGPGHDGTMERVLQGLGHRRPQQPHQRLLGRRRGSATRSGPGSTGPAPTTRNARFILLLSSHLETGHYFNPHAQRIIEGKMAGAKLACIDTRLSQHRLDGRLLAAAVPGHRGGAAAGHRPRASSTRAWRTASSSSAGSTGRSTWRDRAAGRRRRRSTRFVAALQGALRAVHARVRRGRVRRAARSTIVEVGAADRRARAARFATHVWRNAASGNLGGWQVARACSSWSCWPARRHAGRHRAPRLEQVRAAPFESRRRRRSGASCSSRASGRSPLRDELPAAALPEGRAAASSTSTSPASTTRCGPTPTACRGSRCCTTRPRSACTPRSRRPGARPRCFADYVLPMGHASERHDLMSQETHAGAGSASASRCCAWRASGWASTFTLHLRGQPRRGVGGGRVLDRAVVAHRSRRRARHPQVVRVALSRPARSSRSTSTTAGSSRTPCPACPRRPPKRGPDAARVHAQYGAFLIEA